MTKYKYRFCLNVDEDLGGYVYSKEYDTYEALQKAINRLKEMLDPETLPEIVPERCELVHGWLIKYEGDKDYIVHAETEEKAKKLFKRESKYRDGLVMVEGFYYYNYLPID